jgi:hypothetical protein
MLKELVKIANKLDLLGLTKEADILDSEIFKLAAEGDVPKTKEEIEKEKDIYATSLYNKISAMTPYERWSYLMKINRDDGLYFMRPGSTIADDIKNPEVRKDYLTLRADIMKDRNQNSSAYEDRFKEEQNKSEIASRPEEIVSYAAWKAASPLERGQTFFQATAEDKEKIIDQMDKSEARKFLNQVIFPSHTRFKLGMVDGAFPVELKLKFMNKLRTDDLDTSRALIKKFYDLLPSESKAALRDTVRGSTLTMRPGGSYDVRPSVEPEEVGVRGTPYSHMMGERKESPGIPTDQLPNIKELEKRITQRQIDEMMKMRRFEESDEAEAGVSSYIDTIKDVNDNGYYLIMLKSIDWRLGAKKDMWILSDAFASKKEAWSTLDNIDEEQLRILGEIKGDYDVVTGAELKQMIIDGEAKLSEKRFPGSITLKAPESYVSVREELTKGDKFIPGGAFDTAVRPGDITGGTVSDPQYRPVSDSKYKGYYSALE